MTKGKGRNYMTKRLETDAIDDCLHRIRNHLLEANYLLTLLEKYRYTGMTSHISQVKKSQRKGEMTG
jgi:hypothetical protein